MSLFGTRLPPLRTNQRRPPPRGAAALARSCSSSSWCLDAAARNV